MYRNKVPEKAGMTDGGYAGWKERRCDMKTEWENTLRQAIDILKETRATAECNVNNMYWTNVRMNNNRRRFAPKELEKGEELERELSSLVDDYDRMITILSDALASFGQETAECAGRSEKTQLQQRLIDCMQNGRQALERQRVIEKEMLDLEASLEHKKGRGVRLWVLNSHVKI
jgi:predicted RNase H-like nuclease (RuvC/YqgF family)